MPINMKLLKEHLRDAADRARAAKKPFRESGQPNLTWAARVECAAAKEHATLLCSVRAHLRGKVHRKDLDLAGQAAYVGEAWRAYEIVEPTQAACTAPTAEHRDQGSTEGAGSIPAARMGLMKTLERIGGLIQRARAAV